jgi:site-specific DNA-methyltransferase (adenine-specific)
VLKPAGAFWLAIGDEFTAELKVQFHRELGLSLRSWVIWYYTFGVHCTRKFARSPAHLFYFVKDPKRFTFNIRDVKSAGNGGSYGPDQPVSGQPRAVAGV